MKKRIPNLVTLFALLLALPAFGQWDKNPNYLGQKSPSLFDVFHNVTNQDGAQYLAVITNSGDRGYRSVLLPVIHPASVSPMTFGAFGDVVRDANNRYLSGHDDSKALAAAFDYANAHNSSVDFGGRIFLCNTNLSLTNNGTGVIASGGGIFVTNTSLSPAVRLQGWPCFARGVRFYGSVTNRTSSAVALQFGGSRGVYVSDPRVESCVFCNFSTNIIVNHGVEFELANSMNAHWGNVALYIVNDNGFIHDCQFVNTEEYQTDQSDGIVNTPDVKSNSIAIFEDGAMGMALKHCDIAGCARILFAQNVGYNDIENINTEQMFNSAYPSYYFTNCGFGITIKNVANNTPFAGAGDPKSLAYLDSCHNYVEVSLVSGSAGFPQSAYIERYDSPSLSVGNLYQNQFVTCLDHTTRGDAGTIRTFYAGRGADGILAQDSNGNMTNGVLAIGSDFSGGYGGNPAFKMASLFEGTTGPTIIPRANENFTVRSTTGNYAYNVVTTAAGDTSSRASFFLGNGNNVYNLWTRLAVGSSDCSTLGNFPSWSGTIWSCNIANGQVTYSQPMTWTGTNNFSGVVTNIVGSTVKGQIPVNVGGVTYYIDLKK